MWSIGVVFLGLPEERFWSLTPREYSLLLQRYAERRRHELEGSALVAAMLYNINKDPKAKALQPADFLGGKPAPKAQTAEHIKDAIRSLNKAFGGKTKRKAKKRGGSH